MTKESPQIPNFDTFKCSSENLPNSPFHFPNHKSAFLQKFLSIFSAYKITPLCFFRSNDIYFVQMEPIIVGILSILSVQVKIHQIFVIFETKSQFFFKICITI